MKYLNFDVDLIVANEYGKDITYPHLHYKFLFIMLETLN
jgi:hypothetical protein